MSRTTRHRTVTPAESTDPKGSGESPDPTPPTPPPELSTATPEEVTGISDEPSADAAAVAEALSTPPMVEGASMPEPDRISNDNPFAAQADVQQVSTGSEKKASGEKREKRSGSTMPREQRAMIGLMFGRFVDMMVDKAAEMLGSTRTTRKILEERMMREMKEAQEQKREPVVHGVPFDVNVGSTQELLAGAGNLDDFFCDTFVMSAVQDKETGAVMPYFYPGRKLPQSLRDDPTKTVVKEPQVIPATTGSAVGYNLAHGPVEMIDSAIQWAEKNENTLRLVAGCGILAMHGAAIVLDAISARSKNNAVKVTPVTKEPPPQAE